MKVLVAFECSGKVREAFRKLGHDAWSCDLVPADDGSDNHYQCDVFDVIANGWDLMIAHPPCTHLTISGNRWYMDSKEREEAIEFVRLVMRSNIPRWAIENPVGVLSTRIREPDQIIHPWQYGHGEKKRTCLWLHNLPLLSPTDIVDGREARIWMMGETAGRSKARSETYQGIADAMAAQWSSPGAQPHQYKEQLSLIPNTRSN